MKEHLEQLKTQALEALEKAASNEELESLRIRLLGKKGELTAILKQMGKLPAEERPIMGQAANNVRAAIEQRLEQCKEKLQVAALNAKLASEALDVTVPGKPVRMGHRHPMNVSLEELLRESDYVTLHCPLTPATKHMINEETLKLMKPTACLINASRGALVDEPALIRALQEGRLAGAGLDVQENEPPAADNPLYDMPNVILTPHMGWKGLETRQRLVQVLADNIAAYARGEKHNIVSE